jgi:redox-sensitive bicupin YhaK (pirin superfamily)
MVAEVDGPTLAISDSRVTDVGGLPVHRSLPKREQRMVGAWCFLDRFGPIAVSPSRTMTVGPHPHMGLHTVTWLLEGQVLHSDSLGNAQPIRPGQLNLMTAGHGIAHAEDARSEPAGNMDGVQLWVAQPDATRHDPPSFAHHAELPVVDLGNGKGTVLLGEFDGSRSPAHVDSPLVGVEIAGSGIMELPLDPAFEYGLAVLHGGVRMDEADAAPNHFVYLGVSRSAIVIELADAARLLLLGGQPFAEEIIMWWNFVARDRAELESAYADWAGAQPRFGQVASTLQRIDAPRPYWSR